MGQQLRRAETRAEKVSAGEFPWFGVTSGGVNGVTVAAGGNTGRKVFSCGIPLVRCYQWRS